MVDWRTIAREVEPIARRVGVAAPLNANVKGLSTAENWLINICRALVRNARLIVMDETDGIAVRKRSGAFVCHCARSVGLRRFRALCLAPARRNPVLVQSRDRVP